MKHSASADPGGDSYQLRRGETLVTRVEQFREYLLVEKQTALRNVRGRGYLIVPPHEQARYAAEVAMGLVQKGLQKGSRLLNHTRLSELDNDELQRHTDTQVRLSGIGSMMNKQRRDVFKLFHDTEH